MKMFAPNRYTRLVETLQYLEEQRTLCDPRHDVNQLKLIHKEIDGVGKEILKIEIKQRKGK